MEKSTNKPVEIQPGQAHLTVHASENIVLLDIAWRDIETIKEGQDNNSLRLQYTREDFLKILNDAKIEVK